MLDSSSSQPAPDAARGFVPEQTRGGRLYLQELAQILSNSETPEFVRNFVSALNQCAPADALKFSELALGLTELRCKELGSR